MSIQYKKTICAALSLSGLRVSLWSLEGADVVTRSGARAFRSVQRTPVS